MIKMRGLYLINVGLLVLAVFCGNSVYGDDHWSYKGEDKWPGKCSNGEKQSPINLQKDIAEYHRFNEFQFLRYDEKYHATLTNTGHSVSIKLNSSLPPSVIGGGLLYEYILDHLHFHWQSEHTIHTNRFPLELHFVHYSSKFNSTKFALESNDGLAVLGVLFDISNEDNPAFEPLLEKLSYVRDVTDKSVQLQGLVTPSSFLPKDTDTFFRYEGSLTTPTCNEAVVWTVFYKTSYISKRQLQEFRIINKHGEPLTNNYRALQKFNNRVLIFHNSAPSLVFKSIQNVIIIVVWFWIQKLLL